MRVPAVDQGIERVARPRAGSRAEESRGDLKDQSGPRQVSELNEADPQQTAQPAANKVR